MEFSKDEGWMAEQTPNVDGIPRVINVPFKGTILPQKFIHIHTYTELHDKYEEPKASGLGVFLVVQDDKLVLEPTTSEEQERLYEVAKNRTPIEIVRSQFVRAGSDPTTD